MKRWFVFLVTTLIFSATAFGQLLPGTPKDQQQDLGINNAITTNDRQERMLGILSNDLAAFRRRPSTPAPSNGLSLSDVQKNFMELPPQKWEFLGGIFVTYGLDAQLPDGIKRAKSVYKTLKNKFKREPLLIEIYSECYVIVLKEIESKFNQLQCKLSNEYVTKTVTENLVKKALEPISQDISLIKKILEVDDERSVRLDRHYNRLEGIDARLDEDEFVRSKDLADKKFVNEDGARAIAKEEADKVRNEFGPHLLKLAQSIHALGQGVKDAKVKTTQPPVLPAFGWDPKSHVKLGCGVEDSLKLAGELEESLKNFAGTPHRTPDPVVAEGD